MLITLLATGVIFSIMIVVHEFGHFISARRLGIRVEKFSLGFGPKLFSIKRGFTEYTVCALPFGGYVKLAGDTREECKGESHEFLSRSVLDRAKVIFAGPALNYLLAFLCFWLINIIGYPKLTAKVGEVMKDYPAQAAGIVKGDTIAAIDGVKVKYWDELQEIVRNKKTPSVDLEILRNGGKINLSAGLIQETHKNLLGIQETVNLIGIKPEGETAVVKHNVFKGFWLAGVRLFDFTVITYRALGRMITGRMAIKKSVTGPLGILFITQEVVRLGASAVLNLMGFLSASLAIINLVPFPVLDGGHIFFLGLEKLRRRPLTPQFEDKINQVAITLIIGLALLVLINDWSNFGAWDKIKSWFG